MPTAALNEIEQQHTQTRSSHDDLQFLTFNLADELYSVDILKVQEIKGYTNATKIPNMPAYFKGVLNLRGTIVPIVDLRMKFGMGATEPTTFTVVVVVNIGNRVMGMLVDAVSDVLDLKAKDIQPAPELGSSVDTTFVAGLGNVNDHLVTILDINRVLSDDQLGKIPEILSEKENNSELPSIEEVTDDKK